MLESSILQPQGILVIRPSAPLSKEDFKMLGKHFTSAQVRHFAFADDVQAMQWLTGA